jgi:hypothetical protein
MFYGLNFFFKISLFLASIFGSVNQTVKNSCFYMFGMIRFNVLIPSCTGVVSGTHL